MSAGSGSGEDPGEGPGDGPGEGQGDPEGRDGPQPPQLSRLDPEHAAARRAQQPAAAPPDRPVGEGPVGEPPAAGRPVVDTRRYRWMIGIIGLAIVVAISIYQFATHGVGTTGVPAGQRLHYFAAPLADTDLNGDPNLDPPCTLAQHDPRALNVCLLAKRGPLVLAFFVTGAGVCERQVDALQALSRRFPGSAVQFAAVAIKAGHKTVAGLVRSHRWTIPVAYDRDGSVGQLYSVAVCPMAELAYRGGVVRERLIGDRWQTAAALAPHVSALIAAQRARGSG